MLGMEGSGPGGESGATGDNGANAERAGEDVSQAAVRKPVKIPQGVRRRSPLYYELKEEEAKKLENARYLKATAKAAGDNPREVAWIYLRLALPDVLQALVRKATSRQNSSVSAARVICDLLGVRETRRAAKQVVVETTEEEDTKELAELRSIQEDMREGA